VQVLVASAQDALRGKLLYHDIGRQTGSGVSCVDCHGGFPGALHGVGRAAGNPAAIDYALGAVQQMSPLRGRVSSKDRADISAYLAYPGIPSPMPRIATAGPAAVPWSVERLEYAAQTVDQPSSPSIVRLVNAGGLPLQLLSGPLLKGPDAAHFDIVDSDCVTAMSLAPRQSCTIAIVFRPFGPAGARTASVGVSHDWIGGAVNVALIGRMGAVKPKPGVVAPIRFLPSAAAAHW